MPETDAIVAALTSERTRRGVSMRAVAREAGVSPACVHSWEHGTRAPSLHNLRAWAQALGRDLALTCPNLPAMQGLTEKAADPVVVAPGQTIDLLAALQRSVDAAKADRVTRPAVEGGEP